MVQLSPSPPLHHHPPNSWSPLVNRLSPLVNCQVNAEFLAAGDKPLANPRNAAAGGLRLLDPSEAAQRRLSFFAFEVVPLSGVSE
jgi:DNA ligase (NAD+)